MRSLYSLSIDSIEIEQRLETTPTNIDIDIISFSIPLQFEVRNRYINIQVANVEKS